MWIKQVYIDGFGKLTDKSFELAQGLNIIYGANESGKTSMAYLLLNILGGKGKELPKYNPWHFDRFGGRILCSNQLLQADFNKGHDDFPYSRHMLEATCFFFEQERRGGDLVIDAALSADIRRKMEDTETGQAMLDLIDKLNAMENQLPVSIDSLQQRNSTPALDIAEIESAIVAYNEMYQQQAKLTQECRQLEIDCARLKAIYDDALTNHCKQVEAQIGAVDEQRSQSMTALAQFQWTQKISLEHMQRIKELASQIEQLQSDISHGQRRIDDLAAERKQLQRRLEENFKALNIKHMNDIDQAYYRIQQAETYAELRLEHDNPANLETLAPELVSLFKEHPNILEEIDFDDAGRIKEDASAKDQKDPVKSTDESPGIKRLLNPTVGLCGMLIAAVSLSLSFAVDPTLAVWWYGIGALFGLVGIGVIGWWAQDKRQAKARQPNKEQHATQSTAVDLDSASRSPLQARLNELGIETNKQLRRSYAAFLNEQADQRLKESRQAQNREIEIRLNQVLEPFGIIQPQESDVNERIGAIKQCFSQTHALTAQFKSIDETFRASQTEQAELQTQRDQFQSDHDRLLAQVGMQSHQVDDFYRDVAQYDRIDETIKQFDSQIRDLRQGLNDQDFPESVMAARQDVDAAGARLRQLGQTQTDMINQIAGMRKRIDLERLKSLRQTEESQKRKIVKLKACQDRIDGVRQTIATGLDDYIGRYVGMFKEDFATIYHAVAGSGLPVVVQDLLSVMLRVDGRLAKPRDIISSAAFDQMLFAYKVALNRIMPETELPLVIDNAFILYDDDRLQNVMKVVTRETEKRQVIIMTSDRRLEQYGDFLQLSE